MIMPLEDHVCDPKNWQDRHVNDISSPAELIVSLRENAQKGWIDRATLFRIAKVKSPRRAKDVNKNPDHVVHQITQLAFDKDALTDERLRISLLCALHGVRVPTASAILSWVFPERWPVIDRRAWAALADLGYVEASRATRLTPGDWEMFCSIVIPAAKAVDWTPQKMDRWLYGYARRRDLGGTPQ